MALTKIDDRGLKTPIDLLDNEKIRFGTDIDLQIYSDNSNAIITAAGAGDLQLTSTADDVIIQAADNIFINPQGGENGLKVYGDGAVKLYFDGSTDPKFETTSNGVTINGNQINLKRSSTTDQETIFYYSSTFLDIETREATGIRLKTNKQDRLVINSAGKVGINVIGSDNTSPVRNLDIADSSGAILRLISSDDSLGANERLGEIEFYSDDDDNAHIGAFIKAIADGSDASGRRTTLTFGTQNHDSNVNAVEKVRLDCNGKIGIGVTNPGFVADIRGATDNSIRVGNSNETGHGSHFTAIVHGASYYSKAYLAADEHNWYVNGASLARRMRLNQAGNLSLDDGNLEVAIGHGIDFSATNNASGTGISSSSELFNTYEEGSWTPVPSRYTGGAITTDGSITASGSYTRVGRLVTVEFSIHITGSITQGSSLTYLDGLPFTTHSSYKASGSITRNTAFNVNYVNTCNVHNDFGGCIYFSQATQTTAILDVNWLAGYANGSITYITNA